MRNSADSGPTGSAPRHGADARLYRLDEDSPLRAAEAAYRAADRAQLAELTVTSAFFIAEVIGMYGLQDTDEDPLDHEFASIAESVNRHRSGDSDDPDLPGFPLFRATTTFNGWVHDYARTEEISELAILRATSMPHTYSHIIEALTLVHGLPRFHRRCSSGAFTIEHVHVAVKLCRDVSFEYLPEIDEYLADRRADVSIETFRKALAAKVAVLQPEQDSYQRAVTTRNVKLYDYDDGTSEIGIVGPSPEVHACFRRIEAFARTIHAANTSAFGDQLDDGDAIEDTRNVQALMFDILTRTVPQAEVRIRHHNTDETVLSVAELMELSRQRAVENTDTALPPPEVSALLMNRMDKRTDGGDGRDVFSTVVLTMPTQAQWLAAQAKVVVTVPLLTLLGETELPGTYSDGSPLPAQAARRFAGYSDKLTRILTDPATGTPIDARATNYRIPPEVRQTLTAQWHYCAMPGCRRRAEVSEVDHVIPFDHASPPDGGLTRFGNLLPSCKRHHQAKTDRRYDVAMPNHLTAEYSFAHGLTAGVHAPDDPINVAHARLFAEFAGVCDIVPTLPNEQKPEPATPGEGTHYIGERVIAAECPGPEPADGCPGWVEYPAFLSNIAWSTKTELKEWFWDSGTQPPF